MPKYYIFLYIVNGIVLSISLLGGYVQGHFICKEKYFNFFSNLYAFYFS